MKTKSRERIRSRSGTVASPSSLIFCYDWKYYDFNLDFLLLILSSLWQIDWIVLSFPIHDSTLSFPFIGFCLFPSPWVFPKMLFTMFKLIDSPIIVFYSLLVPTKWDMKQLDVIKYYPAIFNGLHSCPEELCVKCQRSYFQSKTLK